MKICISKNLNKLSMTPKVIRDKGGIWMQVCKILRYTLVKTLPSYTQEIHSLSLLTSLLFLLKQECLVLSAKASRRERRTWIIFEFLPWTMLDALNILYGSLSCVAVLEGTLFILHRWRNGGADNCIVYPRQYHQTRIWIQIFLF